MNKLNKKGQSLIMFIIFLPILLMAFALIIDVGLMYHAKIKGESLLEQARIDNLNIKEYFELNDIKIDEYYVDSSSAGECITIKYKINSIFGKLIGQEEYEIQITDC